MKDIHVQDGLVQQMKDLPRSFWVAVLLGSVAIFFLVTVGGGIHAKAVRAEYRPVHQAAAHQ